MFKRLASIAFALLLLLACYSVVWADKPTPTATPPGESGKVPPGLAKKTMSPQSNDQNKSDEDKSDDEDKENDKGRHGVFGTVTLIGSNNFTVRGQGPQDSSWVIAVSANTRFHMPGKKTASLSDLAVGDRVAVNGTPTSDGLAAKQIAITPRKPTIEHRVGEVKAYAAGSSITIQVAQGGSETFALNNQTAIRNTKGSEWGVGDKVTVVARRDPTTNVLTATGIVVHPK